MNFPTFNFKKLLYFVLLIAYTLVQAQAPDGYYTAANGKTDKELKTALFNIIKVHTQLDYNALSTDFQSTDWHPDGYFWDMYSSYHRTSFSGLNREHSLPKSWFGIASGQENSAPIGTDLHNLYPSDATANSAKLNYPIGVVTSSLDFTNGVVKVGQSTSYSPQYTGAVFEPADEYKGDFARDYMYMVTCYEDYAYRWQSLGTSSMMLGGTYPVFRANAVALLLKWHRQDPVSSKEINRNNAVFKLQHNRNPYIDHPELAEFIWGKFVGQPWDINGSLPSDNFPLILKPNPAIAKLKVKVNKPTESTFIVQNLNGIALKTGKLLTDSTMSVSDLKNGMYILVVFTESTRKTGKFAVYH